MFVPQGWRFDLVGIDPADQWQAISAVAQPADAGPWDSVWVDDHFHTTPVPSTEATHEAWTRVCAFAAYDRSGLELFEREVIAALDDQEAR